MNNTTYPAVRILKTLATKWGCALCSVVLLGLMCGFATFQEAENGACVNYMVRGKGMVTSSYIERAEGSNFAVVEYLYVFENKPYRGRYTHDLDSRRNLERLNGFTPNPCDVFGVRIDPWVPNHSKLYLHDPDSKTQAKMLSGGVFYSLAPGFWCVRVATQKELGPHALAMLSHKFTEPKKNPEFNEEGYRALVETKAYKAICDSCMKIAQSSMLIRPFQILADTNLYFMVEPCSAFHSTWPSNTTLPNRSSKSEVRLARDSYPYSLEEAFTVMDSATFYLDVLEARRHLVDYFPASWNGLIDRIGNKTKVGLEGTADLMIMDRLNTGDLNYYGHGSNEAEDLFTISGRAASILKEISSVETRPTSPADTPEDLELMKAYWWHWAEAEIAKN